MLPFDVTGSTSVARVLAPESQVTSVQLAIVAADDRRPPQGPTPRRCPRVVQPPLDDCFTSAKLVRRISSTADSAAFCDAPIRPSAFFIVIHFRILRVARFAADDGLVGRRGARFFFVIRKLSSPPSPPACVEYFTGGLRAARVICRHVIIVSVFCLSGDRSIPRVGLAV